jgi:hypothetical protein
MKILVAWQAVATATNLISALNETILHSTSDWEPCAFVMLVDMVTARTLEGGRTVSEAQGQWLPIDMRLQLKSFSDNSSVD